MDRKQQFLDLTSDFVASIDLDYFLEYVNHSGRDMLGIATGHDLGVQPLHISAFHDESVWHELLNIVFPQVLHCGQWSGVVGFRALDGQEMPVSLRILPNLDDQGRVTGLTGIGQDQRLHHALQTHEEMAERILDSTIEGIIVTDPSARIQRINPAFTQITGYTEVEAIGRTPSLLRSHHHDQEFYDQMSMELRQNGNCSGEIWNRRKSGEVYLQWMSISALMNSNGQVSNFVSIFHDLTEIRAKEAQIEELVFTDPLTGMGNRHKLMQSLGQLLSRERPCGSGHSQVVLMCIDIGQLSPINDRFGMRGGDRLIQYQAGRLQKHLGARLCFFRLTGDELVAVVGNAADLTAVARYAEECVQQLQAPLYLEAETIRLSPSIGLAVFPKDGEDVDTLLACSQTAMLAAKQAGRDCYRFYDETLSNDLRKRLMLEQQLWLAIRQETGHGLELYLQPKVLLSDRSMSGAEVLLRWQHPEMGGIAPGEFIPVAEGSRLIVSLDRWVFEQTCKLLRHWQLRLAGLPKLSINLSARQLQEEDLVQWCVQTVSRYGLQPEQFELEVTETAFINLADDVLRQLAELREAGFSLALDDFGTGYSSLTYLRRLPLDVVKIDRSFVADLGTDPRAGTFLRGLMQLLSELEFKVVAEGIETEEQASFLRDAGCCTGQGFLYSRPMPASDFMQLCESV